MKQLVLLENRDIQALKDGERITINVAGTEFLIGYLGMLKARLEVGPIDSDFEPEPSYNTGGHQHKKKCPDCGKQISVQGFFMHQKMHKDGRDAPLYPRTNHRQTKIECPICGKLIGPSGRRQHYAARHTEEYNKEYRNGKKIQNT